LSNFLYALRPLKKLYAETPAAEFGPLKLKTVREQMIRQGRPRRYINHCVGRIKRLFKWGVENEVVPSSVFHGLLAVAGLQAGRCEARETDPVKPVPDHVVEQTLPHVSRTVASMVRLQLLTGARPGEICSMRTCEIETTGKVWHPHRLRHSAATRLRKEYGLEVARAVLGHQSAEITEVYAEMDTTKALEVMGEVG
jgi:integrase